MEVAVDRGSQRSSGQGSADGLLTRRSLLVKAAGLGVAASTLGALDMLALMPQRAAAATTALPEVQYAIEKYIPAAFKVEGVAVRLGPVYTTFATFALTRRPTVADQAALANALRTVESNYAFSPAGVFSCIAYGIPYFQRLPGGISGSLVSAHMPRLLRAPERFALEEAQPSPSDISPLNPGVSKETFNVPVQIESNDMLLTLRSDSTEVLEDVLSWITGQTSTLAGNAVGESGLGGLLTLTSSRLMFTQQGLPRKIAEQEGLPYAGSVNPASPMWMGFFSQQVGSSGPPPITTFLGSTASKLTTARARDYFDHGSIAHLSHLIQDLAQFYARPGETYEKRAGYMFRSDPVPRTGNADQFTNGGGPTAIPNIFGTTHDAEREAEGTTTYDHQPRIGHTTALQRSSRATNRSPIHIRADGPGFDSMDVPDGTSQPKLQFSIFVPTADFFATMRRNQASVDLQERFAVPNANLGLERFITATRRQNFLVPPRRHRAFPLVELT